MCVRELGAYVLLPLVLLLELVLMPMLEWIDNMGLKGRMTT